MRCENKNCQKPDGTRFVHLDDGTLICNMCQAPQPVFQSRTQLMSWVSTERREYADVKYPDKSALDERMRLSGMDWWVVFIGNYFKRAELLQVETPQGRQALGKMITTAMDCLESAIRVYGPMPEAGVPSGEIIDSNGVWT